MSEPASHAEIIKRVAEKPGLADFDKDEKLKYEVYKLTIEEILNILENEDLDSISLKDLQDYKKGLNEIERGFFAFYRGSIVKGKGLEPKVIQPLIDQPGTKLTMAASFKKDRNEEECLNKLKECRLLLFQLVEHLRAIKLEASSP